MLQRRNSFFFWGLFLCILFLSCRGELTDGLDFTEESNAQTVTIRIAKEELPAIIRSYIETHFTDALISKSLRYQHRQSISYGVFFQSGEFLLFAPNGLLLALDRDGIESKDKDGQEILASELPSSIIQYVVEHYPTAIILFAEKENNGYYEIYLDNNIELHFNEVGNFITKEQDDDDDGQLNNRDDDDDDGTSDDDDDDGTNDDDDDDGTNDDDDDDDGTNGDDDDG